MSENEADRRKTSAIVDYKCTATGRNVSGDLGAALRYAQQHLSI